MSRSTTWPLASNRVLARALLILAAAAWLAVSNNQIVAQSADARASAGSQAEQFDSIETGVAAEATTLGLRTRIWRSIGFLHPAIAHFPIALFSLGALFVALGWKWPALGTQIPLSCMLIGASLAVAAATMGWSLAPEQGYGAQWSFFDWDREINVHRMSGSIVAAVSSIFAIVALAALWRDSDRLHAAWKTGLLVCALIAGLVGHQGGELKYGEDFLPRAIRILTGQDEPPALRPSDEERQGPSDEERQGPSDEERQGPSDEEQGPSDGDLERGAGVGPVPTDFFGE